MGRLIVLEGIDGSGKSTQLALLRERLSADGQGFRVVSFPRYSEPSSALLKMYLSGEFGNAPRDVNAYAASTFFAVDRFASWHADWGEYLADGGLVLTDRYTTSNAIHQGAKLPGGERPAFFRWLYDFEFNLLGLPSPDVVLYMDVPTETAIERIRLRDRAHGGTADIHERDSDYLTLCAECAREAARFYGWRAVGCVKDGIPRSECDIHEEIYALVRA